MGLVGLDQKMQEHIDEVERGVNAQYSPEGERIRRLQKRLKNIPCSVLTVGMLMEIQYVLKKVPSPKLFDMEAVASLERSLDEWEKNAKNKHNEA